MYVDEKRVGEAEVDTRSDLERFIAWAKTRDPNETYLYTEPGDCLIARWDRSEGRVHKRPSHEVFSLFGGRGKEIVFYGGGTLVARTVGHALEIALKIQGEK